MPHPPPQNPESNRVWWCVPLACLVAIALNVLAASCRQTDVPLPRRTLRLLMHPTQHARLGETLKRALQAALPETDVAIEQELRETEIVKAVQNDRADIAFGYADIAYLAHAGQLDGTPFNRLRGIATLNTSPIYVLVGKDSTIRDIDGLRGRRVNLGLPGSSTALTVKIMLDAFGDVKHSYEPFETALAKLAAGSLDAIFAVAGDPVEDLRKAADGGARLVSLSELTASRLRRQYPFVLPVVIPRAVQEGGPVLTIGIERLLICRDGLDKDVVYKATLAFFDSLPKLSSSDRQLRQMNVENAQATVVPLHPGAARYYREQEAM